MVIKPRIREIAVADYPLLRDFLYEAIYVPPNAEPPPKDIILNPEAFIYIDDFGDKHGDCGVVAEVGSNVVGAAWTRIIPAYGHIDMDTPELAVSVLPQCRSQGIGNVLMKCLFDLLRTGGFKQTSLAVQKANPAARFYLRLGYEIVRENDKEWIMIKEL